MDLTDEEAEVVIVIIDVLVYLHPQAEAVYFAAPPPPPQQQNIVIVGSTSNAASTKKDGQFNKTDHILISIQILKERGSQQIPSRYTKGTWLVFY